jgi:cytoskeletal protein CcmA (bactofilin family)
MWKKEETPAPTLTPRAEPVMSPAPERPAPAAPAPASGERAAIGRSITIKGEVSGDEDLLIQGRIEGSVNLKQHSVTVGREGEVKADIVARVVTVEGKVEGNLSADEQVILRASASVQGDISAPRVVLEDGASFRGGVDMGESLDRGKKNQPAATPSQGKKDQGRSDAESGERKRSEAGASAAT